MVLFFLNKLKSDSFFLSFQQKNDQDQIMEGERLNSRRKGVQITGDLLKDFPPHFLDVSNFNRRSYLSTSLRKGKKKRKEKGVRREG